MQHQNKTATAIQSDLEFMRRMYAQRRSLNHPRHEKFVGYSLLTVALGVPAIAAAIVLITRLF